METKIKLGQTVEHKHTGLRGVVISRCECLDGPTRLEVQPKIAPDGAWRGAEWFYEGELFPR